MKDLFFPYYLLDQGNVHFCLSPYTEDNLHSFSSYFVSALELFHECEYPKGRDCSFLPLPSTQVSAAIVIETQ